MGYLCSLVKPRFTEERKEIYNWAGKTRNLTCEPLGEPAPSVEWVRADTILKNNNTFLIYESERSSTLQVSVCTGSSGSTLPSEAMRLRSPLEHRWCCSHFSFQFKLAEIMTSCAL